MDYRVSNQTVSHTTNSRKVESGTPLSSAAYFDAQTKTPKPPCGFASWIALKRANRVKRGQRAKKPVRVDLYADMMKISIPRPNTGLPQYPAQGGGKRGTVNGFSRASRKRMIEFMAKIRKPGHMMFLTLTYPDVFPSGDTEQWHKDFEAFRHRFQRAFPNYSAIWRMELVERKSGYNEGIIAPHYHMIMFTGEDFDELSASEATLDFWTWCSNNWFEIANYEDERHLFHGVDCSTVKNRKHANAYVSKYVAKGANDGLEVGRRWGRFGRFDTGHSQTFKITDECNIELRRLIRKWLKSKGSKFVRRFSRMSALQGCTIFGLGDTSQTGELFGLTGGGQDFVYAAMWYDRYNAERERSHGD